jgi:hypothetical protein
VSEYAARCPACRHSVDDAIELTDPTTKPDGAPEPKPAASSPVEFPSHRFRSAAGSRRIRWVAGLGASVLLAGVSAIGLLIASGGGSSSPALASLSGDVVARLPSGVITWVDPIVGKVLKHPPLQGLDILDPVAVSSDGATVLDESGALFIIDSGRVVTRPTAVEELLSDSTSAVRPSAFADDNQAVLLLTRPKSGAATAAVIDLFDGHGVDLGVVDSAEADPQSLGAFVSEPAGPGSNAPTRTAGQDADVELRVAGAASVVLATASQLDRDVGWSPATQVRLDVYPNSIGDAVAVVLNPLTPEPGDVPMVILNRQGALLAALTDKTGPSTRSRPSWSPGGHQIVYPTFTTAGPAVAITSETGATVTYPAPKETTFGPCIWSPASADVVCESRSAGHDRWLYVTRSANRLIPTPSFGNPLAWLTVLPLITYEAPYGEKTQITGRLGTPRNRFIEFSGQP